MHSLGYVVTAALVLTIGGARASASEDVGAADRVGFKTFVSRQHHFSFVSSRRLAAGMRLTTRGVTTYAIPARFKMSGQRYTVVNGRVVIVQAETGRITDIFE